MSVITLGAIVYCALGYVFAWRRIFREWADDFSPLDSGDFVIGLVMATLLGLCASAFYPPYAALCFAGRGVESHGVDFDSIGRRLAGEDAKAKKLRRLREQAERQREIERLERELGL